MLQRLVTRRTVLRAAGLATTTLTVPLVRRARAETPVVPNGKMTLGWHTNIAPRWLDPQQHDGAATPDNFLNATHDALIKNFYDRKFDYPALAEHFDFAEDAKSATFRLRPASSFTTARRLRPPMSNGATSITTARGPRSCMRRPTASRWSTIARSALCSTCRFSIFRR